MAYTLPTTGTDPKTTTKQLLEALIDSAIATVSSAAINGFIYATDTTDGLARTSDGEGFFTASDLQLVFWLNEAGAATQLSEIGTPLTQSQVEELQANYATITAAASQVAEDAAQTALDRVQTGLDVVATTAAKETAEAAAATLGATPYDTKSNMDLVTPGTLPAYGYVYADATDANNGLYIYPSGGSAWEKDAVDLTERLASIEGDLGAFDTLDPDIIMVIEDGHGNVKTIRSTQSGGSVADTVARAEIAEARGTASDLDERLSRGLTPYGDQDGPTVSEWKMRNCRRKLALRAAGDYSGLLSGYPDGQKQLIVAIAGDSWMTTSYWVSFFAKVLQDEFGFAGCGSYGFQIAGTTDPVVYADTQLGNNGSARPDITGRVRANGTWSAQNTGGGVANPSIGYLTTSEAGAWLNFTYSVAHDAFILHYVGTGGVIRHSWDGGVTWEANTTLSGTGPQSVSLSGVPATAGQLRLESVSGTFTPALVDMQTNDPGVRVHALGAGGANSTHWTAIDTDVWAARLAVMGVDAVFFSLGTNDQSASISPAAFKANINTIFTSLATTNPATDLMWISPFENARTNPLPMTDYAREARKAAVDGGWSLLDLQYIVGDDPTLYDYTVDYAGDPQTLEDQGATAAHPSRPFGSMAIVEAITRMICPAFKSSSP